MKRKNILIVTGTRAEYGLLRSTMKAIRAQGGLALSVLVTGMHLSGTFGRTVTEIEKDDFPIAAKVKMTPGEDSSAAMAASVGIGIQGMVRAFKKIRPDVVLVLGDRVEALAAAVAAAYMNIVVAHVHGGDKTQAGLDESARHAITKLAHVHFPATKKSAERIKRLGEKGNMIHVVGAPGLDAIVYGDMTSEDQLSAKFNLDISRPFVLLVQHSVSTDPKSAKQQMIETLRALVRVKIPVIVVYPNADAGGRAMITVVKEYERKHTFIQAYQNISRSDYLGLLRTAAVLVGNSSSGIVEAAFFRVPVVNIGQRQAGRERAANVLDTHPDARAIEQTLRKALSEQFRAGLHTLKNPYGNGRAGEKIAGVLAGLHIDQALLQKQITY
ncbi:MAG: UDP-N-acetylglucosamine 2-epimerase [Candidatus Paceibacterota bacterium]|jgi:UDP-hydrolysing UDP-N-acetyl-D-glucosamine 2-epimerase